MRKSMKILIAYDGSECAEAALDDLHQAGLPEIAEAVVMSITEFEVSPLPVVTRLTQAHNGTTFSDFYTPDPWDKGRRPREVILGR